MKRLDLLIIFCWILGGLYIAGALLFAVVGTLGGLGILEPSNTLQERIGGTAGCAVIAAGLGVLGAGHLVTGGGLRRRRPWARTSGLIFAVLDLLCCCNAPLGTAFGIFALVVLLSDDIVKLLTPHG